MAGTAVPQSGETGALTNRMRLLAERVLDRETWGPLARPFGIIALVQIVSAIVFLLNDASGSSAGFGALPIDEAWVRMVYAENFGNSFQLSFTSGDLSSGATSLLWVVILGIASAVTGPMGISVMATAKILGVLFAMSSAFLVYLIVARLTGLRRLALAAGIVLAIEPTFGYAAVSGMEVTLFASLTLGAVWAYFNERQVTAGVLLGLMVITRPESWALVILVAIALMGRRLWDRNEVQLLTRDDARALSRVAGPAVALTLLWVAYNVIASGSPLPGAFYATRDDIGLFPFGNIGDALKGYFHHLAFFKGLVFPVTAGLVIWGMASLLRAHNFTAGPLVLFVVAQVYVIAANVDLAPAEFSFEQRRYLDPVIPFVVILLAIGLLQAWRRIRRWRTTRAPSDPTEARVFNFSLNAALLFIVVVPFIGFVGGVREAPEDYSWNTKNIEDTLVFSARWIKENTPADVRIGSEQPGALAYYSGREVVDYSGKHFPDAIDKTSFEISRGEDLDYAFSFDSVYLASWPPAVEIFSQLVDRNTILIGREFIGYELDFDREVEFAAANLPYQIDIESRLLEVVDLVDVGNPNAPREEAEATHEYEIEGPSSSDSRSGRVDAENSVDDDFRTFAQVEQFKVRSTPGERLLIAKRYDAAVGHTVRVFADGQEVGTWELPKKNFFFGESIFVIPGELITGNRTTLRFEFVPTPGSTAGDSFFYWIMKDAA